MKFEVAQPQPCSDFQQVLKQLGILENNSSYSTGLFRKANSDGKVIEIKSPIDGSLLAKVELASENDLDEVIKTAQLGYEIWRKMPAPKRGEIVRQIGQKLREYKEPLGKLVTMESGKLLQEGLGEVQEMIDICDFAVGLSRQLYGFTMHSERAEHRMYEQYHPLGIVGVISAFNFPVAVWSWNTMLAAVCGNVCIWKPSEKTPLTAIACQYIISEVLKENNLPEGIFNYIIGDAKTGSQLAANKNIALISATGSTRMGKKVAETVAQRLGKTLLELGGNNAIIVSDKANLELAIRAIVFGAVGTCGQRCTSTRRIIVHEKIYEDLKNKLVKAYSGLPIGNPLEDKVLIGPLIDREATDAFVAAIKEAQKHGARLIAGGNVLTGEAYSQGNYVTPALLEAENSNPMVQEETFAPILYMIKYSGHISEAVKIQNDVRQGLSSAIFTTDISESEYFLSHLGSDCGIANVNIGTSGAEIGGAFGGEKETGGGRESGSDSWKVYMRRQTNTINYSKELPLAQGIKFDL
jgi:aldehyde dehydrogenase (NAD+)